MGCDHWSPDDPSRPGIKDVLVSRLHLKLKGVMLLASMLQTVPGIGKAQGVRARSDLYFSNPQTWGEELIIECYEAYRLWYHDTRVRLRIVWLLGRGKATQQPACPSKEQHEPTECSSHGSLSYIATLVLKNDTL